MCQSHTEPCGNQRHRRGCQSFRAIQKNIQIHPGEMLSPVQQTAAARIIQKILACQLVILNPTCWNSAYNPLERLNRIPTAGERDLDDVC